MKLKGTGWVLVLPPLKKSHFAVFQHFSYRGVVAQTGRPTCPWAVLWPPKDPWGTKDTLRARWKRLRAGWGWNHSLDL